MKTCDIALLGCGTVGRSLVELVDRNRARIRARSGVDLVVSTILVRDLDKHRAGIDRRLLTDRPEKALGNGADVVVELVGGLEPARSFIAAAIAAGKHVVTANKALLAQFGIPLWRASAARDVRIGFEASVCGGIPIVRALASGLVGERIESIVGILNGTCNYVLTRMSEDGLSAAAAVREAQARGFAEADPSLDVDGVDAAQKLGILAELAFGLQLAPGQVATEGIRAIEAEDIRAAASLGYVIKHLAIARDLGEAGLDLRVHPALLPRSHILAGVLDESNAVLVKGEAVGEIVLHGKGAGGAPTASAVLSDIIEVVTGARGPMRLPQPIADRVAVDIESEYYLRFPVVDVPGVIGAITTALGDRGISIAHASATLVPDRSEHGNVTILLHRCKASALRQSVDAIAHLPVLAGKPVVVRIVSDA